MQKTLFTLVSLFLNVVVFASEHGGEQAAGHGEVEIPFNTIGLQALNLGILLVIIFFAVRKSVVALFKTRYANYNEEAKKTADAVAAAELALSDIKSRIHNLQTSEQTAVETAKTQAEALKNKIILEARAQSEKIKSDTQLVVTAEINNAKNEIRQEIINASVDLAKSQIKSSAESISKKSEKSFLEDISKTKNQVTV